MPHYYYYFNSTNFYFCFQGALTVCSLKTLWASFWTSPPNTSGASCDCPSTGSTGSQLNASTTGTWISTRSWTVPKSSAIQPHLKNSFTASCWTATRSCCWLLPRRWGRPGRGGRNAVCSPLWRQPKLHVILTSKWPAFPTDRWNRNLRKLFQAQINKRCLL